MEYLPTGIIFTCPDCQHQFMRAASKRVQVCPNCVNIAKYGISLFESAKRKRLESTAKSRQKQIEKQSDKPKVIYNIKHVSKKQGVRNKELKKVKHKLKKDGLDGGFVECEGCGNYFDTIDVSHIVALSQNQKLALVKENMRRFCRECHNKWEHGTVFEMIELNCFIEDMQYLFYNHTEKFWKIYYRIVYAYEQCHFDNLHEVLITLQSFK